MGQGFTGRSKIDQVFAGAGLTPDIAMSALDADVIKTYVKLGLGIGIIASVAFNPKQDSSLVMLSGQHLFEKNTTVIAIRRSFSPQLCLPVYGALRADTE